jgi:hypothetical protein
MCCLQFIGGVFHVFAEVVINNCRTVDVMEELWSKGLLSERHEYHVEGDASGSSRDTRSALSDYQIILKYLQNKNMKVVYRVPPTNPAVRYRHNKVNAYCLNGIGERRLFVYQGCSTLDEGLRLVKLKKGSNYIEDDSKHFQHVTTALGYAICFEDAQHNRRKQGTVQT